MKKIKEIALELALISMIATPLAVLAVEPPTPVTLTSVSQIYSILNGILTIVYTIFFIIAAFFIIYAGFLYLTASGDEDKLKKAKQQLIYAIIAIIIALIAIGAAALVRNVISAPPAATQ